MIFSNFFPSPLLANNRIQETASKHYSIDKDNSINFQYEISLEVPRGYTTAVSYYNIEFPFENIDFQSIQTTDSQISSESEVDNGKTLLKVDLEERILNHANPITIHLSGEINDDIIQDAQGIKTLIIPSDIGSINVQNLTLKYPSSFGAISDLEQNWELAQEDDEIITLESKNIPKIINLIWGENIAYDFQMEKIFTSGTNDPTRSFEINIPKIHNQQQVLLSQVTPAPKSAYQDHEGNLFLSYNLEPNTEIKIRILGQIILKPDVIKQEINPFQIAQLTKTEGYWEISDSYELNRLSVYLARNGIEKDCVTQMSSEEKQEFYKLAYEYVIDRLTLRNLKTTSMESDVRLGADNTLKQKTNAVPEDYVDLLSAIYREYTVPTRMVEGHIILDKGYFHTWLEYWDQETGWNIVDPALADYMNQDFLKPPLFNHITLLTRGYNYLNPRVTFLTNEHFTTTLAEKRLNQNISIEVESSLNPIKKEINKSSGMLYITNTGNTIISLKNIETHQDLNLELYNNLQVILPNHTVEIPYTYSQNDSKEKTWVELITLDEQTIKESFLIEKEQAQLWWWDLLVTVVTLIIIWVIIYSIYLIAKYLHKWIKNYYQ